MHPNDLSFGRTGNVYSLLFSLARHPLGYNTIMTEQFLTPKQRALLEKVADTSPIPAEQRRAQILLLYHASNETHQIVEIVGLSERTVQHWRREFLKRGMDIFSTIDTLKSVHKPTDIAPLPNEKIPKRTVVKERYPRVRKKTGIKSDESMAEAGRKVLRFHFARMIAHENGTRLGEDIEELHDMRVATRRMRAAFEVFGRFFQRKALKPHLKGLRATGRALGRVRDLDVFMEKAQHYLATLPEAERSGLDPLMNAWMEERTIDREKMLAYLDSKQYQKFLHEFNAFVTTTGVGVDPDTGAKVSPELVNQFVPVLVYSRLAAVRAYEAIVETAVIEQLHALRIVFKELRYTVEFFREVLGDGSDEVIEEIKLLQDHLGDLNDADVACQILRQFIETWEERQINVPLFDRKNPEPVVAYLAAKHAERHQLMVTFPEAWARFNRPEFRKELALAISEL